MGGENQTVDNLIVILGFGNLHYFRIPFFVLVLLFYSLMLTLNIMIPAMIYSCPTLHHPMFFFLGHLSLCDITLTTSIVPVMLPAVLRGIVQISLDACIAQFQIFGTGLTSECFLLVVMSFDRYLAICQPLRYASIMNQQLCLKLVILCWTLGFTAVFSVAILLRRLEFCGTIIDHFFCDFLPVMQLSCSDIFSVNLEKLLIATPILLFSFTCIIVTYVYILSAIFKIPSVLGRQKAFSTCSSHLAVVSTFLGSLIGIYVLPSSGYTLKVNKAVSLLYTIGTPLFNPVIYCVRNMEIREAFKIYIWKRKKEEKNS